MRGEADACVVHGAIAGERTGAGEGCSAARREAKGKAAAAPPPPLTSARTKEVPQSPELYTFGMALKGVVEMAQVK